MRKIAFLLTLLVIVLVCLLPAAPAQAQAARTFLSAAGSDSNNCTNVATPCRHLATAFAATAANGEIYVLDPANYGSLTITRAVSIEGHGWASIAPVSGGNAITINANPGDRINIIGVVLDGTAIANTVGIQFNSGAELHVVDCVVRNFMGSGVAFVPTISSALMVSNTFIAANAFQGVLVAPQAANLTVQAVLNRVELHSNFRGVYVYDYGNSGGTIDVSAVDTVASNNTTNGFEVESSAVSSPVAHFSLVRATAAKNGGAGVAAEGPQSTIRLAHSLLTGNGQGWQQSGGSLVLSYGNNFIDGNTNDTAAPPLIAMQ
jgi:hypothetical protein